MTIRMVLSLILGALFAVVPVWAAPSGQATSPVEAIRPLPEEWCPDGTASDAGADCVLAPILVHAVAPAYPEIARLARVTGRVELEAIVGTTGEVVEVRVVKPNPVFTDAALEAVRQRRYRPAQRSGIPIAVAFPITVRFDLVATEAPRPQTGPQSGSEDISVVAFRTARSGPELTGTDRQAPREKK